jgi:hypothetical protein
MVNTIEIKIKKSFGSWTKYGGGRYGVDKANDDFWFCQCCRSKLTKDLPNYMFPIDSSNMEFVRICSTCEHLAKVADIHNWNDLIFAVRKID